MILSHQKRFVLLRPWKTASQTMTLRLAPYDESPYDPFFSYNPYLQRIVHQHLTFADFAGLPESKLGYFAATFVRNPYDRVYSGFRQLQKDLREQPLCPFPEPWIRDHVMAQLSDVFAQLCRSGFQFDDWLDLLSEEQVYEIGRNTNLPLHPAHYWTHHGGRQSVDFVGRVEDFEADFQRFLDKVEIDPPPAENANVVELETGPESHPHGYRYVHRMHARSIDKINRLFDRDFELFEYERILPATSP
jgi:hypothetical protein